MTKLLLSACLIVKNEELILNRCLTSLKDVVDEIIVVDTGSTDSTIQLARQMGAKVYKYAWDGNFANARNESLKYARGEYVLIIDADEYLDPEDKIHLRGFLESESPDGLLVSIVNYVGSLSKHAPSAGATVPRIFKRGYTYSGSIHEQILHKVIDSGGVIKRIDLRIHHLGYLSEIVAYKNKPSRNIQLLKEELQKNPDDFFHLSNLMAEYMRIADYDSAVKLGEETFEKFVANFSPQQSHLLARVIGFLVAALTELNDLPKACYYAARGEAIFPHLPDVRKYHGEVLLRMQRPYEAIQVLKECRELGDVTTPLIDTLQGLGTFLAAADLGTAWTMVGDLDLASKWYFQSFTENPNQERIIWPLMNTLPIENVEVRKFLRDIFTDDSCYFQFLLWCTILNVPEAETWVAEIGQGSTNAILERIRFINRMRSDAASLVEYANSNQNEVKGFMLGLYQLEMGRFDEAHDSLTHAGAVGAQILEIESGRLDEFFVEPLLWDLIGLRATNLLKKWLPIARDIDQVWVRLRLSPMAHIIDEIDWVGNNGWQCESNARRLFLQGDIQTSMQWFERALKFPPTVSRIVLEADLALSHQNLEHARKIVYYGRELFRDSIVLQRIEENIGLHQGKYLDASLEFLNTLKEENDLDAHRAYQSSVFSMPLPTKLAKLHERAYELTKQIPDALSRDDLTYYRYCIEQIQDIITFLRGSLDTSTEAGKAADSTYAFYYKVLVQWFVYASISNEEFDGMLDFFKSWSETWKMLNGTNA